MIDGQLLVEFLVVLVLVGDLVVLGNADLEVLAGLFVEEVQFLVLDDQGLVLAVDGFEAGLHFAVVGVGLRWRGERERVRRE